MRSEWDAGGSLELPDLFSDSAEALPIWDMLTGCTSNMFRGEAAGATGGLVRILNFIQHH